MSKALSPLEALKIVREKTFGSYTKLDTELLIIETALKDYEELQEDYCKVVEERGKWQKETSKKLKALEIIVKKEVSMAIKVFDSVDIFNKSTGSNLTKEEFDLIKEVIKSYEQH